MGGEATHDELPPSKPAQNGGMEKAPAPAATTVTVAQLKKALVSFAAETSVSAKQSFAKCNKQNFDAASKKYCEVLNVALDSELLSKSPLGKKAKGIVPYAARACAGGELLLPFVVLYFTVLFDAYAAIIKYTPPGLLPAVWGAVLCFFGGEYMTLIAAVEAFELSGGYNAGKAATVLAEQAFAAIDASAASNKAALDKLEPRELVAHKMAVAMNTLDPEATQDALGQLYLCWMAMLATLKIQFARTVSLGLSISRSLKPFGDKYVIPAVQEAAPKDVKKWVPMIIDFAVKAFVVSLAWMVQTVVSTVQSALRGGMLFSTHLVDYLSSRKYIKPIPADSVTLDIIALGIALMGILFQVSNGWGVPFPLNLVTWPLDIVEWFLRWQISQGVGEELA